MTWGSRHLPIFKKYTFVSEAVSNGKCVEGLDVGVEGEVARLPGLLVVVLRK